MAKYSVTISGILIMVVGSFLVDYVGLTEKCGSEIANKVPLLIGGVLAWYGRWKAGGISLGGWKV